MKIVKFVLKVIGILTVLSLIIMNITFTNTDMHGCEGRPDIAFHLFLIVLLVIYLSWYILTGGNIDPHEVVRQFSRLGERFGFDEDSYEFLIQVMIIVLCVFGLCGGMAMGWYMVYSTAIIPRGCTVPPSIFARVYYWTVGGVFGLLGIACLVITVGVTGYGIYKGYKWVCEKYRDNRRAKRLLQTVNRASLGAQSRVTFLYEDIRTALEASSKHSYTTKIASRIFTKNILNLCTVYASDICYKNPHFHLICTECEDRVEPTDTVVVLYGDYAINHRECMTIEEYLPRPSDILKAINTLRDEVERIARDRPFWDIEDIRRERIIRGKELWKQIIIGCIEEADQQESMHEEAPIDQHNHENNTPASSARSMDDFTPDSEYDADRDGEKIELENRQNGQREDSEGNWVDVDDEDRGDRNEEILIGCKEKVRFARVGKCNRRKVKRFIRIIKQENMIVREQIPEEEEEMGDRQ